MTEEPSDRKLLSLAEASKAMPQISGRGISANAVWRWCRKGIKSRCGQTINLEHVRLGGKLYTTAQWVVAFGKRLAEADAEYFQKPGQPVVIQDRRQQQTSGSHLSKRRLAQIRKPETELREMGV